jgi:hypothetical protein
MVTNRAPAHLFSTLCAEFNRYMLEQKSQVEHDVLTFPATEGDRLSQTLFSNLAEGGFCTLVVTGRRDWDPRSHYFQTVRFAARRGCRIHRAFLLPHRHLRHAPALREHIALDVAAGIQTEVLFVGDLLATLSLPLAESLEFGVWDGVIGCIGVFGPGGLASGLAEWRVTSRAEDMQTLDDIKALLLCQAQRLDLSGANDSPDLEEPMITTAPIAHEMAAVLCQGDHVSPEDCSWYHSVWQYLRIFNMVSTPTWHSRFYLDTLQALVPICSHTRVLISGTADYSMLAHVLWAFKNSATTPQITVLDLCETPLFLCKWYGKSVGARITTTASDILTYESGPFDVIATDAFLTRFSSAARREVIRKWHDLLAPKGIVVTTVRIERGLSKSSVQATPDQADAFRRKALQEARRWQSFLSCPPERIANLAQRYAERMTSYSFSSEDEVRSLFQDAGLNVKTLIVVEVPGEMASTLYAEVVACRD